MVRRHPIKLRRMSFLRLTASLHDPREEVWTQLKIDVPFAAVPTQDLKTSSSFTVDYDHYPNQFTQM